MPSLPSAEARTRAMRLAVSMITSWVIGRLATALISDLHSPSATGPLASSASTISPTASSSSASPAVGFRRREALGGEHVAARLALTY